MKTAPLAAVEPSAALGPEGAGRRPRSARAHALHPRDDALDAAQIAARAHVGEAGGAQKLGRRRRLPGADLEHQRAAGREQRGRGRDQPPHQRETVGAAVEGQRGLALHLGREASPSRPSECTAGWRRSARKARAAASGASRSPSTKVTARPSRSAFARATSSAAGETSVAKTAAPGRAWPASARSRPSPSRRRRCAAPRRRPGARAPPRSASRCRGAEPARARRRRTRSPRTPSCRRDRRPTRPPGAA